MGALTVDGIHAVEVHGGRLAVPQQLQQERCNDVRVIAGVDVQGRGACSGGTTTPANVMAGQPRAHPHTFRLPSLCCINNSRTVARLAVTRKSPTAPRAAE